MTDEEHWQQLRTSAAAKNMRRFHANKRAYSIYMDRLGAEVHNDNVHWLDQPPTGRDLQTPFESVGLYLGEYHIDMDNNPGWHAVVTVDRPSAPNGDVRITSVVITGTSLETTSLPLPEITKNLFGVGGVLGKWTTMRTDGGHLITSYTIEVAADGHIIHPNEKARLRGTKERAGMYHPDTFVIILDALREYAELKATKQTMLHSRQEFVAKRTGYSVHNVKDQIKKAREWAAQNQKETK
jgi:hypothetical protein